MLALLVRCLFLARLPTPGFIPALLGSFRISVRPRGCICFRLFLGPRDQSTASALRVGRMLLISHWPTIIHLPSDCPFRSVHWKVVHGMRHLVDKCLRSTVSNRNVQLPSRRLASNWQLSAESLRLLNFALHLNFPVRIKINPLLHVMS
jgi:hypothetical protein